MRRERQRKPRTYRGFKVVSNEEAESAASSYTRGSIYRILFISHLFWRRPDPPGCRTAGRDLSSAPGWSAGANDQRTNAVACARFGVCRCTAHGEYKESPGRAGALGSIEELL
jgi:hypothetical protein